MMADPKKKPAYNINVRLPPPKTKYGWLGSFFYRLNKNREKHITRMYGIGGLAAIFLSLFGIKNFMTKIKEGKVRQDNYDLAKQAGVLTEEQIVEHEKVMAHSVTPSNIVNPDGKPDHVFIGGGTYKPEIRVSEQMEKVEVTIKVPILGNCTMRVPIRQIEFDDEGNVVCDETGFPKYKVVDGKGPTFLSTMSEKIYGVEKK